MKLLENEAITRLYCDDLSSGQKCRRLGHDSPFYLSGERLDLDSVSYWGQAAPDMRWAWLEPHETRI